MKMSRFVYGDSERIFVNTSIGCNAKCSYCYLPDLNIKDKIKRINAEEAIKQVENLKCYNRGENGTIISIGCYSECMDNVYDTFIVADYFLKQGNYVQLATKKQIEEEFLKKISQSMNAKEKLWIYVSLPIISDYIEMEKGTDSPYKRIDNFMLCKQLGINSVLYIKPYIEGKTDKDIYIYLEIIDKYSIPVVVGERLSIINNGKSVLVGEDKLYAQKAKSMSSFIDQLKKRTKVYTHSIECIKEGESINNG